MDRHKLDGLTREELVALASELGIVRPRSLTAPELIDEIVLRTASNERDKARSRGWLGRARSLLASVIERGLHLPDVAKALRATPSSKPWPSAPTPLATMTLAEIYAAQGHLEKALQVLDEILIREPEHADARSLRQRLDAQLSARKRPEAGAKPSAEVVQTPSVPEKVVETNVEETPAVVEEPVVAEVPTFVAPNEESVAAEEPAAEEESTVQTKNIAEQPEAAAVPTDVPEELPTAHAIEPDQHEQAEPIDDEETSEEEAYEAAPIERPNIEELPLPERYDVDEIVGIAVDPTTVYLYWEVRPVVLARAHARLAEGRLVVRFVSVTPSWDGPVIEQRDLPIDALYGDAYVRNLRPSSNVRISVGWLAHGVFAPFAIGDAVAMPRKEPSSAVASATARWTADLAAREVVPRQTTDETVAQLLDIASRPPVDASSTERAEPLGEWAPQFDVGQRGLSTNEKARAPRPSHVGGSSELVLGGASEQVRPADRTNG